MKSNKSLTGLVMLVVLSMVLAACATQDGLSGVSANQKENLISVTMDQLELGETFFVGKVTEVASDSVSIENVVFRIDRNSSIPGGLVVGDVVAVNGLLLPDQTRYAAAMQMRSVADVSMDDSSSGLEFKLYGIVESMETLVWTVSGETIHISENAIVETGIQVGIIVEVEGVLVNGALRANKISKEDSITVNNSTSAYPAPSGTAQPVLGQEVEFYGTLQSIQNGLWVVDGKQVQITSQTEIKGMLSLGDMVKVHAARLSDGSYIAREIELAAGDGSQSASSGENEYEFKGYVEQILNGSWLVSGVVVLISADTSLDGNIQVGDFVEVKGQQQSDGSVNAVRIHLESGDDSSSGSDDNSGSSDDDGSDDNSGSSDDDDDDDNSGSGGDDGDDDNSGSGGDDGDDDNSGSSDDDDDDDNSGSGGGDDDGDDDDDNSGSGGGDDDDKDGDD